MNSGSGLSAAGRLADRGSKLSRRQTGAGGQDFEELARPLARTFAATRFSMRRSLVAARARRGICRPTIARSATIPRSKEVQGDLLLEEGAVQAAQGKPEADETFRKFIRDFPQSPRVSEAWVALAELAFHAAKPDLTARAQIPCPGAPGKCRPRPRSNAPIISKSGSRMRRLRADEAAVVTAANEFLQQHPESPFTAEVRMKLAEAYFRRQDFANAQTQFELLAQQKPGSAAGGEGALFCRPLARRRAWARARSITRSRCSTRW